jgi:hypothetical protein
LNNSAGLKVAQVRIICYQAARDVKKAFKSPQRQEIDAYLSNFQFSNFKEVFSLTEEPPKVSDLQNYKPKSKLRDGNSGG